ncbi:chaplin [Kitasatospora xanthocidica]|uniref:Chaplin n=1 Tax=Kitasatospora xanthocidica TaxID=83382 RepID=A0A372ZXI8_9ACTN|nr:chaplin [Kitasatospora xanthocidica]RGD60224.1 chaplin [Kitasatospora xanthocidica]
MQNMKKAAVLSAAAAGLVLGAAGSAAASAGAEGVAANSPGVVSGNQIQIPVHVPINLCGNSINVVGLLNPAFGNACANVEAVPQPADDC